MNIGEKIKHLRRQRGYTQQELAKIAGIPLVTLQQYERGVRKQPRLEQVEKIATALGISADKLLDISDLLSDDQMYNLRKRLREILENANPEDVFACFGTYDPFDNLLNGNEIVSQREAADIADSLGVARSFLLGEKDTLASSKKTIDLARAAEIAESTGVSLQYLLGQSDDPTPDISPFIHAAAASIAGEDIDAQTLEDLKVMKKALENDTLLHASSIKAHSDVAIRKALKNLDDFILELCRDENAKTDAQKLRELEVMPVRIGQVKDFIKANRQFLKKNMSFTVPADNDND